MLDELNKNTETSEAQASATATVRLKEQAIDLIFSELRQAEIKHPYWPDDLIHAVGILTEEVGEAMQAAIDCTYADGDLNKLKLELAQCGAMAIRALIGLA